MREINSGFVNYLQFILFPRRAWLVLLFIIALPQIAKASYPETITTSSPFVNIPRPNDDPRWARAFAHWDRRAETREAEAAVAAFAELAQAFPGRTEAQLWLLRSAYLFGMRNRGDKRMAYLGQAAAAGDAAIKLQPDNETIKYWRYCNLMQCRELTPEEMEGVKAMGRKYESLRELPIPDNDPLWAEAVAHFDKRLQRDEALAAIKTFAQLEKKFPAAIEPKLWLARGNYWMHYISADNTEMAKWLIIASGYSHQALSMEPRNAAAAWWTAASLGEYASYTSFLNIVRYGPEIFTLLQLVTEEDPNYYYGGISQYLALAISRGGYVTANLIPVFGYSKEQVQHGVEFAAAFEPRYLLNHFALAEMYISQKKLELAKPYIDIVLSADPAALKLAEPENRVCIDWTRKLLQQNDK